MSFRTQPRQLHCSSTYTYVHCTCTLVSCMQARCTCTCAFVVRNLTFYHNMVCVLTCVYACKLVCVAGPTSVVGQVTGAEQGGRPETARRSSKPTPRPARETRADSTCSRLTHTRTHTHTRARSARITANEDGFSSQKRYRSAVTRQIIHPLPVSEARARSARAAPRAARAGPARSWLVTCPRLAYILPDPNPCPRPFRKPRDICDQSELSRAPLLT